MRHEGIALIAVPTAVLAVALVAGRGHATAPFAVTPPPPPTNKINLFVFINTREAPAITLLREAKWDIQVAVNNYYSGPSAAAPQSNAKQNAPVDSKQIEKIFDDFKGMFIVLGSFLSSACCSEWTQEEPKRNIRKQVRQDRRGWHHPAYRQGSKCKGGQRKRHH